MGDLQANGEPSSKKRKIQEPDSNGLTSHLRADQHKEETVIFEAKDISFQIPVRKKLHLEIARNNDTTAETYTIRARNAGTGTIEYEGVSSSFGSVPLVWKLRRLTDVQSIS